MINSATEKQQGTTAHQVVTNPVGQATRPEDSASKQTDVKLSTSAQQLNALYLKSQQQTVSQPPPEYLDKLQQSQILTTRVTELAAQIDSDFTEEQISRIVSDLSGQFDSAAIPADVNASSGSVYSFLTDNDRAKLAEAYNYALENNASLKDVEYAAFNLGRERFIEAKQRSGTIFGVISAEDNSVPETEQSFSGSETLTVQENPEKDRHYINTVIRQIQENSLFNSNPFLNSPLFTDPVHRNHSEALLFR